MKCRACKSVEPTSVVHLAVYKYYNMVPNYAEIIDLCDACVVLLKKKINEDVKNFKRERKGSK